MLTAADIRYDPSTHTSKTIDGIPVPHVTHILSEVGVSTDFDEVGALSRRIRDRIEYRGQLGTAVHADCHAYDDGDVDAEAIHPEVRPFVYDSWATCREAHGLTPIARERRIFHALYFYTGIFDGIFALPSGRRVMVDLKIGDPSDAAAHLQTAAYVAAHEHAMERQWKETRDSWMVEELEKARIEWAIHERWAVQLTPDKRIPYVIHNYTARQSACRDFEIFKACLTVYSHQPGRRPRSF